MTGDAGTFLVGFYGFTLDGSIAFVLEETSIHCAMWENGAAAFQLRLQAQSEWLSREWGI